MAHSTRTFFRSVAALAFGASAFPAMTHALHPIAPQPVYAHGAGAPPPLREEIRPPLPRHGHAWNPGY
jgi:hypothetical protein